MDGDSFDQLSVGVHRLREGVTRRGAVGVLFGGLLAAVGVNADETDARRRRRKKKKKGCKGFGGRCSSSRDCCNGRCQGRFCVPHGGGGGGGGSCNGRRCSGDERCCRFNGIDMCLPRWHDACRFDNDECAFAGEPCGWNGPVRFCCQSYYQCCDSDRRLCCPDFDDWRCGDIACEFRQDARAAGDTVETTPFTDAIPEDAED